MSRAAKRLGVHYVGIAERMESRSVQNELLQYLDSLRLRHLSSKGGVSQADVSWFDILPKVKDRVKIGDQTSFEWPWKNENWGYSITKQTLKTAKHIYEVPAHLCATGFVATTSRRLLMMKLKSFMALALARCHMQGSQM